MPFLLDTNTVIALMKQHAGVVRQVEDLGVHALSICAPVEAELWFGVYKSQRPAENEAQLRQLLHWLPCLPFSGAAAQHAGDIRAHLARCGTPIGPYDIQIAAIARAANLCLVTRNLREFERVPGLQLANWIT